MSTQPGYQSPTVTTATALPKRTSAAVLIIPVVCGDHGSPAVLAGPFLDAEVIGEIETGLNALGAKGSAEQLTRLIVPALPVASVLAVGLGAPRDDPNSQWPAEAIRRAAGVAARSLNGVATVITTLSELNLEAAVEGLILGSYQMHEFRSAKTAPKDPPLSKITALSTARNAKSVAARAVAIASAVATARDLVNTPPSHLHPAEFARRAKAFGSAAGLQVQVLDETALAKRGFGGIIGVGQGSSNPPRLVRLTYRGGKGRKGVPRVALIGKGITFDTGGISLKDPGAMDEMKFDMSGAAAVLGAMSVVAALDLPLNVVGLVPTCENMPSGRAIKPGDIVTSAAGLTVEILNTDAEGRLILCDALHYARRYKPQAVVDLATLTGACVVALGIHHSGVMANDDALARELVDSGLRADDRAWQLPLTEEYGEQLKSNFADLANVAGRDGGAITAGAFLGRFAKGLRWAHMDIAGSAYVGGAGKGSTGRPVALLTDFLLRRAGR